MIGSTCTVFFGCFCLIATYVHVNNYKTSISGMEYLGEYFKFDNIWKFDKHLWYVSDSAAPRYSEIRPPKFVDLIVRVFMKRSTNSSVTFYLKNIALPELLYRNQRGILRLEQWSDGLLRCSHSFRCHAPDRSPVLGFKSELRDFWCLKRGHA